MCFLAFIQELKHNRTSFSLQLLCLMCLYLVKPWEKGSKTVLKQVLLCTVASYISFSFNIIDVPKGASKDHPC